MPWIQELAVTDARETLVKGSRMIRRFWADDSAAHSYLGEFVTAQDVTFGLGGGVIIATHYYAENSRTPRTLKLHYAPGDVLAVAVMTDLVPGVPTYANHDDRLILPGGYLYAHPGTMHKVWDAYRSDGSFVAGGVSVADGRQALSI